MADLKTPWNAQSRSLSDGALVIKNAAFEQVCVIAEKADRSYKKDAEHLPIASLIEAAPDMLAALYGTLGIVELVNAETPGAFNDDLPDLIAEARAAIAKAKGE